MVAVCKVVAEHIVSKDDKNGAYPVKWFCRISLRCSSSEAEDKHVLWSCQKRFRSSWSNLVCIWTQDHINFKGTLGLVIDTPPPQTLRGLHQVPC
ncbi:hypothetical protein KQX54_015498 [Cotesia glomerata]|uniref:Uncharacterized protein n=1 Tax=Cotesia glomerata TaxID=32391 RepID=A0AAV7IVB9_COTGL|nr:hypothetical protein KQX54_015498 [Cotesia glomerata]